MDKKEKNHLKDNREKYFKDLKRIVVKIGSSSLTSPEGGLDLENMGKFTGEVSEIIKKRKLEVIIVTSGAIAAGLKYLNILKQPKDILNLQAAASAGQVELMRTYSNLFLKNGLKIGQILLTHEDTTRRQQYLNIKGTIEKLISLGVIPIINENDSVATDEIKFGDNDRLAALVSCLAEADLLVILSDIDGMYDKNPAEHRDARLITEVERISSDIEKVAGGIGSTYGSGGMVTKIKAARVCSFSGTSMIIANSGKDKVLEKIINGEIVGTFFKPKTEKKVKSIKKWIAFGTRTRGSIILDRGAENAIVTKGRSILPVGVIRVGGKFSKGDTLKVYSEDGRLIAKGISNFSNEEVEKLKGKNKRQILEEYGSSMSGEMIHRDSLVVF